MKIGEKIKTMNKKSRKRRATRMRERIKDMELNVDDNTLFLAMRMSDIENDANSFVMMLSLLLVMIAVALFIIAENIGVI